MNFINFFKMFQYAQIMISIFPSNLYERKGKMNGNFKKNLFAIADPE